MTIHRSLRRVVVGLILTALIALALWLPFHPNTASTSAWLPFRPSSQAVAIVWLPFRSGNVANP